MIGFIRGILIDTEEPNLTIDVNGLGYELQIPASSFCHLPPINQAISLYTHFVVREDGQYLFGFITKKQRTLFRVLIKATGVGPKVALAILAAMEPDTFIHHVLSNAPQALENIPGIGSKTARRLIIELKDKLANIPIELSNTKLDNKLDPMNDALSALVALGYKAYEAKNILNKHKDKNLPSAELIKLALKEIT